MYSIKNRNKNYYLIIKSSYSSFIHSLKKIFTYKNIPYYEYNFLCYCNICKLLRFFKIKN